MSVKKMTPYLFFDGKAEEAIRHYEAALSARVEGLLRWGERPGDCPEGMKGRVMHAALHVGDALLMVSDGTTGQPAPRGVSIAVEVDDFEDMSRRFDALAERGTVIEAIHDVFWGDKFGVVKDGYGVVWMFTCPQTASGENP